MESEEVTKVRNFLIENGWIHFSTCSKGCGAKKHKYMLPNTRWKVWVLPDKGTFFLIRGNNALTGKIVEKFNEVYNEYKAEISEVV